MVGEYLICKDQAGVKSYLPLDTSYMKKVKGGYTINLNATKTVKIKIKNAASSSKYIDVDSADAKAVAWVVNKKIMEPTSKNEFYSKAICTKGMIKDDGDHKFRPDDAVTRVELARFIYYAYK